MPAASSSPGPALCDECQARPATVFLTQCLFGETTNRQLCAACAAPIIESLPPADPIPVVQAEVEKELDKIIAQPADCPPEVALSDPVTVHELATALRVPFYRVIAVLFRCERLFKSPESPLDFETASAVCRHFGVTPRRR